MKRKVCVFTGSRADYGLLKLLMKKIHADSRFILQIVATGMHLSPSFGFTLREIENDGFEVDRSFECLSNLDTSLAISEATSQALVGFAKAIEDLKPDVVVILGDRFEAFAAASASLFARIPVAHIHGGEITSGAYDESLRHSISKMASIHFVATPEYGRRVVQLGEHPSRVHVVGGLGVDAIASLKLETKVEIEKKLGLEFKEKNLLITFHPTTLEEETSVNQVNELLNALSNREDTLLIFTLPNADTGGQDIARLIIDFVELNQNAYVFHSLGQLTYLSCLAHVDGIVGNSSSGLLEAPSFKVGTVNIGTRQTGRLQASSVLNCEANSSDISSAIERLYSEPFRSKLKTCQNPYGEGGASSKIIELLALIELEGILAKSFFDLPELASINVRNSKEA